MWYSKIPKNIYVRTKFSIFHFFFRVVDKPLTEDQMMGEVTALLLGDTRIWSAGIYWEQNKFPNKTWFAPFAYKNQLNTRNVQVEDLARLNKSDELYINKQFFKDLKSRWSNYFDPLEKFWLKMYFRSEERGDNIYPRRYEHFPEYYRAANLEQGVWTAPYYDCKGLVKKWIIPMLRHFLVLTVLETVLNSSKSTSLYYFFIIFLLA